MKPPRHADAGRHSLSLLHRHANASIVRWVVRGARVQSDPLLFGPRLGLAAAAVQSQLALQHSLVVTRPPSASTGGRPVDEQGGQPARRMPRLLLHTHEGSLTFPSVSGVRYKEARLAGEEKQPPSQGRTTPEPGPGLRLLFPPIESEAAKRSGGKKLVASENQLKPIPLALGHGQSVAWPRGLPRLSLPRRISRATTTPWPAALPRC
jgi:hypothetical protein